MVIYLDTYKKMNIMPYIKLRQCDKLVDMYQFCIFDDGMETDLSKFTSAEFLGTNAKGQMASFVLQLPESGNVINAVFPEGMSGAIGKYQNAYIRLSTDDGVTSTCEVNVLVLPAVDLNAEQAEEYHTVLDDVLVQYNETWNSFLVDRESDYADLAERMNALDARYETNEDKLNALQQMLEQIGVYSKVESDEKYATKQDLSNHEAVARQELNDHKTNTSNPHNVTKAQVGLTNVEDFGIATQEEAQAGTTNDKYMTPLRTKQSILEEQMPDTDTGWVKIPLNSGFNGWFFVRRHNNLITLYYYIGPGTNDLSNSAVVCTIPSQYRIPINRTLSLGGNTVGSVMDVRFNKDGTVIIRNTSHTGISSANYETLEYFEQPPEAT